MGRRRKGFAGATCALLTLWLVSIPGRNPPRASPTETSLPSAVARADSVYGALADVMMRIGVPGAHALGLTGAGVRVGLLDGTIRLDHEAFSGSEVLATRDFVEDDEDVTPGPGDDPEAAARGTSNLSLLGASRRGVLVGPAFDASFVLARTSASGETSREDEARWVDGLEWLETQAARVVLSGEAFRSFDDGFVYPFEALDGATTPTTVAAALAAGRGVLVVAPVGDEGPGEETLSAPSDAVDALAVGATDDQEMAAAFSAEGPTADGRPKPDVWAPGVDVPAADGSSPSAIAPATGTAAAAALVAGAAALFVEAHPTRSTAQLMDAFRASARDRIDRGPVPLIDVGSAISFPDGVTAEPLTEVDGAGRPSTLTPLFEWDAPTIFPPALPVSFTVLVSADSTFTQVLIAERVVGTFARRLSRALPARRTVYWRVDAETVQGIRRKTATQPPIHVPPWVTLAVLDDPRGQTIQERRPTLEWEPFEDLPPPAGPWRFDVHVFSDRDEEPVVDVTGIDSTTYRIPDPLPLNVPLRWRVVATDPVGQADTATSAGPFVVVSSSNPPITVLYQNFPNPFPTEGQPAHETRIWFDLARNGSVALTLYDLRGRRVRRLIPASGCSDVILPPGLYGREDAPVDDPCVDTVWDGRDDQGRRVEPGVYLLRLRAGDTEEVRRVVYWP